MQPKNYTLAHTEASALAQLSVLRNTYMLLSLTLLFSALTATVAMFTNASPLPWFVQLIGMFGLLFLVQMTRNSGLGLISVFAFTGFMGYTLGPVLNMFMTVYRNGSELIITALGGTGLAFLALSAIALTTRKNFGFLGNFLFIGLLVAVIASIANIFLHISGLQLAVAGAMVFIASGLILFDTSRIIHNGETNYISATVSLYLDIFNLFVSLLQLLAAFSGDRK
jgi:modulator of FtsH protease